MGEIEIHVIGLEVEINPIIYNKLKLSSFLVGIEFYASLNFNQILLKESSDLNFSLIN